MDKETELKDKQVELAMGEYMYLAPPVVDVPQSDTYGYIGLNEDGSYTSDYYTTTMISATSNNYELNQYYFAGNSKGIYKLQYNIFLIQYNKTETKFAGNNMDTVSVESGKMFTNVNGQLCYKSKNSTIYYIYLVENLLNSKYELKINTNFDGINGTNLNTDSNEEYLTLIQNVKVNISKQDCKTIVVKDLVINVTVDENAYTKTQYTEVGGLLPIVKPEVKVTGIGTGVNQEKSFVQISVSAVDSTQTLTTMKFSEWANAVVNNDNFKVDDLGFNNVSLKLLKNGIYVIKYSVQAVDEFGENIGEPKILEYVISNGDSRVPIITLSDELDKSINRTHYCIGDIIAFDNSGIILTDNTTTSEDLLRTMKISLVNKDCDKLILVCGYNEKFSHKFKDAGNYRLEIKISDNAGNKTIENFIITVTEKCIYNVI